jgi:multidrug efflux pump
VNISAPFIRRPVATTLLMVALGLAGAVAFELLPVSPLPQVDFPTISVSASLPGASPETMASSVATPLERQFGRIAAVTEMTSSSSLGSTSVTLQFDLDRDIDAAARDVQAAINAARGYLPANLPSNPNYRKVNPADSPIMILSLTSSSLGKGQIYDAASTVMAQSLSRIRGVGQVVVGGGALPAVRVELNPSMLSKYGIGLEQVRSAIAATNANTPKGQVSAGNQRWEIGANDQLLKAIDYSPLIVAYRNGAPVRIRDVGAAEDSIEDIRTAGYVNGEPAVMVIIFRQPGANIITTVDAVREVLPRVKAAIPPAIDVDVVIDQTTTIRASVHDIERALIISLVLVVLVVFAFLRNPRTAMIPSVAVPLSLIGTFGAMYLFGYGLDNLSLMALTISTGFVVDDAIVVIENITRYREQGKGPLEAALEGAKEIGFTVMSMSLSLVAVFIPILLMSGIVGRLFREFAVTMAAAIVISMVVSLTATPMMCAHLLKKEERHGRLYQWSERMFAAVVSAYGRTLEVVLRYAVVTLLILIGTIGLTGYLFLNVSKGFFPQQDTGRINGSIQADQGSSFQVMNDVLLRMMEIVKADPAVSNTIGFSGGGGTTNTARLFIALKPLAERNARADEVIGRLRPRLGRVPGATLYLQSSQDVRVGGRQSNAQYQFTMQGDNLTDHQRREQRSAEPRAAGTRGLRPRGGRTVRHCALPHRRDAVRRIRTAPGLDDVSRPESVPRGHGSRTAVLAERHVVERVVRAVAAGQGRAAERLCELVAGDGAAVRQPSGTLSRGDDLVQPGTRYRAR